MSLNMKFFFFEGVPNNIIPRYATYLNIQHCLHHRLTYLQKNVIISTDWCGVNVRTKSPEPNNNKIKE